MGRFKKKKGPYDARRFVGWHHIPGSWWVYGMEAGSEFADEDGASEVSY
jgi:hypothetical protein